MSIESGKNARLPEDLEEQGLGGMMVGETAWSVPWAMEVDTKRRLWLQSGFTGHDEPGGTVRMLVERVADGFVVDLSRVTDYAWNTEYALDAEELEEQDPENPKYLPVVELRR